MIYLQKAIEQSELKEQNVQDQLASVIKVVRFILLEKIFQNISQRESNDPNN
jgi:hypothetical protein